MFFFLPLSSKMLNECFPCSSEAGGVSQCLPPPFIRGCGCRDQLTRVEAAGAALKPHWQPATKACRTLGAAGQIQGPWGFGGTLGLWAQTSENGRHSGSVLGHVGCKQERGSSFALTTLNMGIWDHTARPLWTDFPLSSTPDPLPPASLPSRRPA